MRIAFGQAYFISNSKGGTEQYTYLLLKELIQAGHEVFVFTFSDESLDYNFHGINVHQEIKAGKENALSFSRWLQDINPHIYHQHTLTPEMDVDFLSIARDLNIPTCMSLHLASATCIRGSMILMGKEICDGKLDESRCMKCFLQKRGYSTISQKLLPPIVSLTTKGLPKEFLPDSFQVFRSKRRQVQEMIAHADRIFVFSDWQVKALSLNFAKPSQVLKVDHIVAPNEKVEVLPEMSRGKMKLAYIGRITEDKGLQLIINYFVKHPSEDLELHIYPIFDAEEVDFAEELKLLSKRCDAIRWKTDFDSNVYAKVDAVVVPSMVLETGPMVVLEAMQAKKIIIASDRIGNPDKFVGYSHGFIFEMGNNSSFTNALQKAFALFGKKAKVDGAKLSSPHNCAATILDAYSESNSEKL